MAASGSVGDLGFRKSNRISDDVNSGSMSSRRRLCLLPGGAMGAKLAGSIWARKNPARDARPGYLTRLATVPTIRTDSRKSVKWGAIGFFDFFLVLIPNSRIAARIDRVKVREIAVEPMTVRPDPGTKRIYSAALCEKCRSFSASPRHWVLLKCNRDRPRRQFTKSNSIDVQGFLADLNAD